MKMLAAWGRYSVFASLFDLRAAVPADEVVVVVVGEDCSRAFGTGGMNFCPLGGEQTSGSSWEIQV